MKYSSMLLPVVAAFPLFIFGVLMAVSAKSVGGDASIYLSFAKNFWSVPFSVREGGVPVFGATGPLWVLWTSLFGDNFSLLKAVNFLIIIGGVVLGGRKFNFFYLVPLLLLFTDTFYFMASLLYEVPLLFLLFVILFCKVFEDAPRNNGAHSLLPGFLIGLLIVLRPEFLFLLFLVLVDPRKKIIIANLALAFLPLGIYHLYMFFFTGEIIPSSIYERLLRHGLGGESGFDALRSKLRIFLENFVSPVYLFSLFTMTLNSQADRRWWAIFAAAFSFFILLCVMESPRWRYFVLLDLLCSISVAKFFVERFSWSFSGISAGLFTSAFIMASFILNAGKFFSADNIGENFKSTFEERLAPDLDLALSSLELPEQATVLIYEFGGQYSSKKEFISIDGIVGKFPKRFSSPLEFEKTAARTGTVFVSSRGCNRARFRGTFVELICVLEREQGLTSQEIVTEGVKMKLLKGNDKFRRGQGNTTWNGIYSIEAI